MARYVAAVLVILVGLLAGCSLAQESAPAPAPYIGLYDSNARWTGLCISGTTQSPIDVTTAALEPEAVVAPGAIALNYSESAVVNVTNQDKGIQINVPHGSYAKVKYGDKDWTLELKQIHFHHPVEHVVNGEEFEIEAHLVHAIEETGGYGVFSIRSTVAGNSKSNALLLIALALAPSTYTVVNDTVRTWDNDATTLEVDLQDLFEDALEGAFIQYSGSLTTPPCTEGVQWFLFLDTQTIGQEQLDQYKSYVNKENDLKGDGNRRGAQPVNGRLVQLINPEDASAS